MDEEEKRILVAIDELETKLKSLQTRLHEIRVGRVVKVYCYSCDKDITYTSCTHFEKMKK